MKNIHVLATDKPSKLFIWGNQSRLGNLITCPDFLGRLNQHIYITNDEEIKKGDWFIDDKYKQPIKYFGEGSLLISSKKIILTTDQDLIKDGVQAIDDEFLEWFVKNPSYEFVEVIKEKCDGQCWKFIESDYQDTCTSGCEFNGKYKIIIPKEQPKKETPEQHLELINNNIEEFDKAIELFRQRKSKQETLEEYISEVTKNFKDEMSIKFTSGGIKLGAKWQQEQNKNLYSEEEMIDIFFLGRDTLDKALITKDEALILIEQFKKKK